MKIKNATMVKFLNSSDELIKKKLPIKLYYALSQNLKTFAGMIQVYQDAYEKAKGNQKELIELINQEIDASVQTIPKEAIEMLDTESRFDPLTWEEYEAISFMIEE